MHDMEGYIPTPGLKEATNLIVLGSHRGPGVLNFCVRHIPLRMYGQRQTFTTSIRVIFVVHCCIPPAPETSRKTVMWENVLGVRTEASAANCSRRSIIMSFRELTYFCRVQVAISTFGGFLVFCYIYITSMHLYTDPRRRNVASRVAEDIYIYIYTFFVFLFVYRISILFCFLQVCMFSTRRKNASKIAVCSTFS